ncbi:MAG: FRG domain-containing protein [Planctomycetaceae bacterium]
MTFRPHQLFGSLGECFAHLREEFPDRTTKHSIVVENGLCHAVEPDDARHLFRGENAAYPVTSPLLDRLRAGQLDPETLAEVERTRDALEARLADWLRSGQDAPDPLHCRSYLRHYGFPTEHLDLTCSLKVAAYFSAWHGPRTLRISDEGTGIVCVASAETLRRNGVLEDIRDHPYALRPRQQHAYTFRSERYPDLKAAEAIAKLDLRWFAFRVTTDDRLRFGSMTYLLETHTDHVGSWLCTAMHAHVKEFGPLGRPAAEWIAERIPPLPMTMKPAGLAPDGRAVFEGVTPGEAGFVYIDADVRRANAEVWSGDGPLTC